MTNHFPPIANFTMAIFGRENSSPNGVGEIQQSVHRYTVDLGKDVNTWMETTTLVNANTLKFAALINVQKET